MLSQDELDRLATTYEPGEATRLAHALMQRRLDADPNKIRDRSLRFYRLTVALLVTLLTAQTIAPNL